MATMLKLDDGPSWVNLDHIQWVQAGRDGGVSVLLVSGERIDVPAEPAAKLLQALQHGDARLLGAKPR